LFDKEHDIVGARVRTYLLERSRLVYQPEVERNYHIFYQLLAGAPGKERKDLGLDRAPADFAYLVGGGPTATPIRGVDDKLEFELTQKALSTVGIAVERQWQIFRLLAALLHLGNVEVKASRNEASIDPDDASMSLATELLGVDKEEFKKWTVKKQLITRSEKIVTNLNAAQALVVRDSVAKFIYSCLFDWLVAVINESLAGGGAADRAVKFIGVLDIYGFEHFKKNSFEQFCINWANEKLQQEFNAHVFKLEQEEYVREEINWTFIDFADNQMCIDVIEGKMGILTLLDEESRLPAGADLSFAGKLFQQINKPEQKAVFKKPRFGQNAFTISHYAHDVTYDVDGFIEKNRDTVPDEHLALLQNSSNPLLKDCLEAALQAATAAKEITTTPSKAGTPTGPKRAGGAASTRKPTLGSIFKHSLINLMETINNTNVHYIRCIKPNEAKNAWEFDSEQVLSQLRACGVLETIKISCAGYPNRWTFGEFAERYEIFIPPNQWQKFQGISDLRPICTAILENSVAETDKYQIGLTKIFFRPGMVSTLDRLKKQRLDAIVTIVQKNYRRHVAQKHYQSLRMATIKIQSWRRGTVVRRLAEQMRKDKAAISIQSIGRMFLARKAYQKTRQAVVKIQSGKLRRSVFLGNPAHPTASFTSIERVSSSSTIQGSAKDIRS
jgi:myosin-5